MLKSIVQLALVNAAKRWFSTALMDSPPAESPLQLNTEELKKVAIRIGSFFTLLYLNLLLFVGGLLVTAVAVAHSFDVSSHFVPTSVFWTGLILGGTGFTLTGVCARALLNTRIELRDFVVKEPEAPPFSIKDRFLSPFWDGLREGWRRQSDAQASNHANPAA